MLRTGRARARPGQRRGQRTRFGGASVVAQRGDVLLQQWGDDEVPAAALPQRDALDGRAVASGGLVLLTFARTARRAP